MVCCSGPLRSSRGSASGLQYGCSTRGPDILPGLTFYLQKGG